MQAPAFTPPLRKPAIERKPFVTHDGTRIMVAHFHPHGQERGILLIPPLIGGSFILFGRQFGYLVRQGYRVVSFNYRGHDLSEGRFSLLETFDDVLDIARHLRNEFPETPLVALGICSGSMPIFHVLDKEPEILTRLVFVNAIHHLQQTATPIQAVRMYVRRCGLHLPSSLGAAATEVFEEIFPDIDKGPDHFGILHYDRVAMSRISWEYLIPRHPNTRFRSDIPTLCVYGRHDEMLKLDDADQEEAYRRAFEERFSNIDFDTFASDHFMTGIKEDVARSIHQFLHDLSEIPLPTGF